MDSLRQYKASPIVRECLAEMMGTFILCAFGIGSVAQFLLGKGAFGSYFSVDIGWGMGVVFGVYWSGGISGGHINPAVTLAMAVCGRCSWGKVPFYWLAQCLGAFLASACVLGVYRDFLIHFAGSERLASGANATAGIFSSYPPDFVSNLNGFADQLFGTALFVGTIFALLDNKNIGPGSNLAPLLIGLTLVTLGASFGVNAGFAVNPARDFATRLFSSIGGWGGAVFSAHDYWFWYPVLAQFLGGVLGGVVYEVTIGMHHGDHAELSSLEDEGSENYPEDK